MRKWFFIAISSILLYSCETVVPIDIPEHTPRLVLYSYIEKDYDYSFAALTDSRGLLDVSDPNYIDDAEVNIYRNGNLLTALNQDVFGNNPEGNYSEYTEWQGTQVGDEFEIRASYPGYDDVSATQKLLPEVNILSVRETGVSTIGEFDEELTEFEIEINDLPNETNYYALDAVIYYSTANETDRVEIESLNPAITRGLRREVVFSDEALSLDNNKIKVGLEIFGLDLENDPVLELIFRLKHISEDRYLYGKSYRNYREAEDNPFAEPVTVHSNIENGFGIFSLESKTEFVY